MRRTSFFFLLVASAFLHIQGKTTEYTQSDLHPVSDETISLKDDLQLNEDIEATSGPTKSREGRIKRNQAERRNNIGRRLAICSVQRGSVCEKREPCTNRRIDMNTRVRTRRGTEYENTRNIQADFSRRQRRSDLRRLSPVSRGQTDEICSLRRVSSVERRVQEGKHSRKSERRRDRHATADALDDSERRRRSLSKHREPLQRDSVVRDRRTSNERRLTENDFREENVEARRSNVAISQHENVNTNAGRRSLQAVRRTVDSSKEIDVLSATRYSADWRQIQRSDNFRRCSMYSDETSRRDGSRLATVRTNDRNERIGFDMHTFGEIGMSEKQRRMISEHVQQEEMRTRRSKGRDESRREIRIGRPLKTDRTVYDDFRRREQMQEKRITRRTDLKRDSEVINLTFMFYLNAVYAFHFIMNKLLEPSLKVSNENLKHNKATCTRGSIQQVVKHSNNFNFSIQLYHETLNLKQLDEKPVSAIITSRSHVVTLSG